MNKLFKILIFFFVIPFLILIRILSPIVLIRFHPINSQRLGHFLSNTEIYLLEKKMNVKKKLTLDLNFFNFDSSAKQQVCNLQVSLMIKRKLFIFPTKIIYPFYYFNNFFKDKSKYIVKNFYSDRDPHGLLDKYENSFEFTESEEEKGKNLLKNFGIKSNDKFVCLNVRDGAFLEDYFNKKDFSYHSYRNWNIENFKSSVEWLIQKGYFVFRVGRKSYSKLNIKNKKYVDLNNSYNNDFLDIYLGAKCEFCITTQSGFDSIPYVFRRPILYLTVPISHFHLSSRRYLLATKHHFFNDKKISLEELLEKNLFHFNFSEEFEKNNIKLKELSSNEILNVTIDMYNLLNGNIDFKAEKENQKIFWEIFLNFNKKNIKTQNLHSKYEAIFAPSLFNSMIKNV